MTFSAALRVHGSVLPAGARLLDPSRPGPATAPTAYNFEGLMVSTADVDTARLVSDALGRTLRGMDCGFDGPGWLHRGDEPAGSRPAADIFAAGVRLRPLDGTSAVPDPWTVLTELRANPDPAVARSVSLNHILSTPEQVGGNPFALGHGRVGLDSYGIPGLGGRGPVTFVGPTPRADPGPRRPRVVLLDTAVADHPWFVADPITGRVPLRDGRVLGEEIHPYRRADGRPTDAAIDDRLRGTLGTRAGHGTFIAGLLRQACPEADIVALPVMGADGVVPEHMLVRALDLVVTKQVDEPGWADAVVMSLGYYNETPEDLEYSSGLKALLVSLGGLGVAVFVAAGNDATSRPSYPAAFAVDHEFDGPDILPVVSVAALNPDGTTASFSNDGPWVIAEALGVNLVSSSILVDGSGRSDRWGRRSAVDPDSFRGGFAVWSGTSFAAPLLAGQYLARLVQRGFPESVAERRDLLPIGRRRHPPDPTDIPTPTG